MEAAATLCRELATAGWEATVASRASEYVTQRTWNGLFRSGRHRSCTTLAAIAAEILSGKDLLHQLVGRAAHWVMSALQRTRFEQELARELAANLPLPPDTKLIATARGVQITGILLCLADGRDLVRCQCFIDLALAETKTQVKRILTTALGDWKHLADYPPARRGVSG